MQGHLPDALLHTLPKRNTASKPPVYSEAEADHELPPAND